MTTTPAPIYLTEEQAAERFAVSPNFLGNLRRRGKLPAVVLSSRCVRYALEDLCEYFEAHKRGGAKSAEPAKGVMGFEVPRRRRAPSTPRAPRPDHTNNPHA